MSPDIQRHILFMSAYSVANGENKGRATDIIIKSPCKEHPDTGTPCKMLNEDKRNSVCYSCKYVGGHLPPSKQIKYFYEKEHQTKPDKPCEVELCNNRGAYKFHGKVICFNCREMVRKRISRGVAESEWFVRAKVTKNKRWA